MKDTRIAGIRLEGRRIHGPLLLLAVLSFASPAYPQGDGVYWHTDPDVQTCSMVIDPALTQSQWHRFVQQAGAMIDYKSLAPAEPLGRGHFGIGLDYAVTPVDQHDPAWINTFEHPDANCPLGDRIKMPSLRAAFGLTRSVDVSGFWSDAPGANYGLAGGAVQYAFLRESGRVPAAAVSAAVTFLTGVPDFDFEVYSVGLSASKRIASFVPYAGVRQSVGVGTEKTDKVDLTREIVPVTHGFIGAGWSFGILGVAAQYDIASVNTFAVQIGLRR